MGTSISTSHILVVLAVAATVLVVSPVSLVSALPSGFPTIKSPFPNPWSAFQNLSGCHFGDERQGLAKLKDYLCHFGYLPDPSSSSSRFTDAFDADLEEAIKTYQRNFGLNVTGELDTSTVTQMMAPRCGVADVVNGTSTMGKVRGRNLYTYFPGSPTWPRSKKSLKYAITATSATTIDRATLSKVFASAFARWSAATTLNFTETASASDADITIGFYGGDHGDGEAFDGPLGTLAHAFSPTDGRFHLDAAEAWVASGDMKRASSDVAVDLESVAVHEIGHLLGLGHSSVQGAIMYPTITSRTRKVDLESDDVVGIQRLYGSNPSFKGVAPASTSSRDMDSGARLSRPWSCLVGAVGAEARSWHSTQHTSTMNWMNTTQEHTTRTRERESFPSCGTAALAVGHDPFIKRDRYRLHGPRTAPLRAWCATRRSSRRRLQRAAMRVLALPHARY